MQQKNDEQQKESQKKNKQNKNLLILQIALKRYGKFISELMVLWGKLSVFFTVLFYLCAWGFLSKIGAQDLYLQSSSTVNMLAIAAVVAIVLALIMVAIIYPSLSVFLLTTQSYKDNKIPFELLYAYILAPAIFLATFIVSFVLFGDSLSTLFIMVVPILIMFWIMRSTPIGTRIRDSLAPTTEDKNDREIINQKVDMFSIYLGLIVSAIISMFTLLNLNSLWVYEIDNTMSYMVFFICILLGYIPGGVYIVLRAKQIKVQKTIKIMINIIVVVVCLELILGPIKVRTPLFKSIGVYQEEQQMFLLLNKDLKEEVSKSFFTNNKKLDKESLDNQLSAFQKSNIFTAYTMYYLGNVRLLCKNYFNPDQVQGKNDLLNSCFVFKPDEVRRIYRKIDSQGSKVKD